MSQIETKIEAHDRTILEVLDKKKYTVDYFQREYSWEKKHIEQLVTDLATTFLTYYDPAHDRSEVENYNTYYLGPYVLSEAGGERSIIDGQQRITSLTLLMVYLHHLQREVEVEEHVESMIYSEKFGTKSFNINVPEREACMRQLFEVGEYTLSGDDDESTRNLAARYADIDNAFPTDRIDGRALPYFIDWLKERVILVEIVAFSDDNAYTIFETMNDRGLNLTSTEMLKGYILSRFKKPDDRRAANQLWKKAMQELHEWDKDEDLKFFQAWFRGQYAETIRQSKAGSTNEDFEKIGTRFHGWFRESLDLVGLNSDVPADFVRFINRDFKFFHRAYLRFGEAEGELTPGMENVFYQRHWGIAESLRYTLYLAPLCIGDTPEVVARKIDLVAGYLNLFATRRSVNFRNFSASSIRYTMSMLAKEIRRKPVDELHGIFTQKVAEMEEGWDGMAKFRLHGMNGVFVKYLLARISGWLDEQTGGTGNFSSYYDRPYEVEHIWADHFDRHRDEFDQQNDFAEYRNRIGALVLLPKGTNQSYSDKPYEDKLEHYVKENLLVKSICGLAYENNPNFRSLIARYDLPFEPHAHFKKADIEKRSDLYGRICEVIWDLGDWTGA